MIRLVWFIVTGCIVVSAILVWHGQAVAIAAFMGLAGQALGILSPSPLKQHNQGGSGDTQVDASKAETVNVTTPAVPVAEPAEPVAP